MSLEGYRDALDSRKQKVCTIKSMKEKYDEEIVLLKQAVSEMQQLLKNPQRLIETSHS